MRMPVVIASPKQRTPIRTVQQSAVIVHSHRHMPSRLKLLQRRREKILRRSGIKIIQYVKIQHDSINIQRVRALSNQRFSGILNYKTNAAKAKNLLYSTNQDEQIMNMMSLPFRAIVAAAATATVLSAAEEWKQFPIWGGGNLQTVEISPSSPDIWYTYADVDDPYRSEDAGKN